MKIKERETGIEPATSSLGNRIAIEYKRASRPWCSFRTTRNPTKSLPPFKHCLHAGRNAAELLVRKNWSACRKRHAALALRRRSLLIFAAAQLNPPARHCAMVSGFSVYHFLLPLGLPIRDELEGDCNL